MYGRPEFDAAATGSDFPATLFGIQTGPRSLDLKAFAIFGSCYVSLLKRVSFPAEGNIRGRAEMLYILFLANFQDKSLFKSMEIVSVLSRTRRIWQDIKDSFRRDFVPK